MNATIARLSAEVEEQQGFIANLLDQVEAEERDLVPAERSNIEAAEARVASLSEQLEPLQKFEARRASAAELTKVTHRPTPGLEVRESAPAETRTLGELFTESEEFRSYSGRGSSAPVVIPEFRAVGPDPLLTTTAPGNVLMPEKVKYVREALRTPYPLLDYVGRLAVGSNAVSYVVTTEASGAAVVPEGKPKPPVVWTATETTFTLEMVAGWFKASRQALQDITGLRGLIDQKLRQAIDKKLAADALTALNAGLTGGNTTTGVAKAPMVEVVRQAIAELQATGVNPSAVLVNPTDAAKFDIAMLGKPLGVAQVNGGMWGLPIIPVPQLTAGTAVVGNISDALIWFHKDGLSLYMTDSDVSDGATGTAPVTSDFRSNILTFLGEVRGKFAVVDASVIRKVVVTP